MSELRAKTNLLNQPQDGTVGKLFNYMCDHDLTAALEPGFFASLRNNLLPGDMIRLIQKDSTADHHTGRVIAYAEVMVLEVLPRDVIVAPHGSIIRYVKPPAAAPGAIVSLKWNVKAQAHEVVAANGDVLASFNKDQGGKAAAEAYIATLTPKAA
jgi:hypothetical protein